MIINIYMARLLFSQQNYFLVVHSFLNTRGSKLNFISQLSISHLSLIMKVLLLLKNFKMF